MQKCYFEHFHRQNTTNKGSNVSYASSQFIDFLLEKTMVLHRTFYEQSQEVTYSRPCKSRLSNTRQNMKFSIKDFFTKCDQIRMKLWI